MSQSIGVFAYNFPHWKTQQGLFNLVCNGFKPDVVFLQDKLELNLPPTEDITPKGLYLLEPDKICCELGLDRYYVVHNTEYCAKLIADHKLDVGVILGARILKKNIIDAFKLGIINMHPGILPQNRGLNNIVRAKRNGWDQGVTVHFIDEFVDRGTILAQETIDRYPDDTLKDIHIRIQNLEQRMMIDTLKGVAWK